MKRILLFFIVLCLILPIAGCLAANSPMPSSTALPFTTVPTAPPTENTVPPTSQAETNYYLPVIVDTFRDPFTTAELCDQAVAIVAAKLVGASFSARDPFAGMPEGQRPHFNTYIICSSWELEIQHTYFGDISGIVTIAHDGGIRGCFLDEQLEVVEEYGMGGISTFRGMIYPEPQKTYLFLLRLDKAGNLRIVDIYQYLYEINENEIVTDYTIPSYKSILSYLANETNNPD